MPWETRRLTYPEVEELLQGDQTAWNRIALLAAWFMSLLPAYMADSVAKGIGMAFTENATRPTAGDLMAFARSIPGYREPKPDNDEA